jgi:hypothetical protein
VAAARDDQEGAFHGVVDGERHPLHLLRQRGGVEHGAEKVRVAVELKGEIHLAARQPIEARQEVLGVLHAGLGSRADGGGQVRVVAGLKKSGSVPVFFPAALLTPPGAEPRR